MIFADYLNKYDLKPDNSVVIGYGIMQALGFYQSDDLDITVDVATYKRLKNTGNFQEVEKYGRNTLVAENIEIGTEWGILGGVWKLEDLTKESVVIDGARYISIELLLRIKQDWKRPKDIDHIKMIKSYLEKP